MKSLLVTAVLAAAASPLALAAPATATGTMPPVPVPGPATIVVDDPAGDAAGPRPAAGHVDATRVTYRTVFGDRTYGGRTALEVKVDLAHPLPGYSYTHFKVRFATDNGTRYVMAVRARDLELYRINDDGTWTNTYTDADWTFGSPPDAPTGHQMVAHIPVDRLHTASLSNLRTVVIGGMRESLDVTATAPGALRLFIAL